MAEAPLTLGTAGHIDHGKTALARALTGKDTDRLPEEHERGISIELGYARLELPSGRTLSVVDVPGHERFVRTMVAGATGIDLFLMCIAADDGVMPQTREHLAVLRQLGVERGVVAVTKADVADPSLATAEAVELMPEAEVVPVAARRGDGLAELLAALDRAAEATPSRASEGGAPMRLHIDRSFTLKGIGTVVTGTLWSGSVAAGDQIEILPSRLRARVRSVQVHDQAVERAAAGQRVALNLVGIARDEVARGDVVVADGAALDPAYILDVRLAIEIGSAPVEAGTRVHVHHGTRESPGRVYPLGDGFAQLRLDTPLVAMNGDRLILRQVAPPDTIGGGTVVEAPARRHGTRTKPKEAKPVFASLGLARSPDADVVAAAASIGELLAADGERPRTDGELVDAAGVDSAVGSRAFRVLETEGSTVRVARNLHFDRDALARIVERVVAICERDGSATIASVRDELGTSRKYAQAVLEHLDATRVTLRREDQHVLRAR
ncbi:MAG: selenocysteine-specific elongation factor [Thermoleophilaceae bacterium]|nr:selenocysteine-specific elongation factor [Thermoleophilaceae bacterium]